MHSKIFGIYTINAMSTLLLLGIIHSTGRQRLEEILHNLQLPSNPNINGASNSAVKEKFVISSAMINSENIVPSSDLLVDTSKPCTKEQFIKVISMVDEIMESHEIIVKFDMLGLILALEADICEEATGQNKQVHGGRVFSFEGHKSTYESTTDQYLHMAVALTLLIHEFERYYSENHEFPCSFEKYKSILKRSEKLIKGYELLSEGIMRGFPDMKREMEANGDYVTIRAIDDYVKMVYQSDTRICKNSKMMYNAIAHSLRFDC